MGSDESQAQFGLSQPAFVFERVTGEESEHLTPFSRTNEVLAVLQNLQDPSTLNLTECDI